MAPAGLGGGKTGFSESKWSRNRENVGFPGSKWFKKYLSAFLKPVTRADSKAIFGKEGVRPCVPENAGRGFLFYWTCTKQLVKTDWRVGKVKVTS